MICKKLRYKLLVWFFKDLVQEELINALHPEFGWWWQEDEDGGKAIAAAEVRGWCTAVEAMRQAHE